MAIGLVVVLLLAGRAIGATLANAQASQVSTPVSIEGDRLTTLIPALPDSRRLYAVGREALYASDDGGVSWDPAGPVPPSEGVVAAVDDPLLLFAGTHPPCARAGGEEPPLSRSDDGGATWTTIEGVTGVLPLAVWARSDSILGSSCFGLQLFTNDGEKWESTTILKPDYEASAFAVISAPDATGLVAGTSEGGTSRIWRLDVSDPAQPKVSEPLLRLFGGVALAAEAPAGKDERYVVGAATGVYVSNDGGKTWHHSRAGLEDVTISVDPLQDSKPIPQGELDRGYGIPAVAIDPNDPAHLWAGTVGGLFESVDAGAHWSNVGAVSGQVGALVVAAKSRLLLVQTEEAVVAVPI